MTSSRRSETAISQPAAPRTTARTTARTTSRPFDASLSALHVLGGQQRTRAGMRELEQHWYGYGKGVALKIDHGEPSVIYEHRSADGTCGPDDPELFKSATVIGDRIYACSQTELMVYTYPGFERLHHFSNPMFNDVHHVVPGIAGTADENSLWASVSGQDLVAEISMDESNRYGELLSMWGVDGSDPSDRIDPNRDYRINTKLKPHAFHPNHLFRMPDGTLWVTRFETRDAVQVGNPERRIAIDRERCHDGVVDGDRVYFTTIDGHVIEADTNSLEVVGDHELLGTRENTLLGWCRGLTFHDDYAIVGFSRIRHTKVRGALSWVRNGLSTSEPTRIAVYDRNSWKLLDEIDLEPAGCNAVFSIFVDGGEPSRVES